MIAQKFQLRRTPDGRTEIFDKDNWCPREIEDHILRAYFRQHFSPDAQQVKGSAYATLKQRALGLMEKKNQGITDRAKMLRFDQTLLKVAQTGDGPALYAQYREAAGLPERGRD
jgi:hypothetical protein